MELTPPMSLASGRAHNHTAIHTHPTLATHTQHSLRYTLRIHPHASQPCTKTVDPWGPLLPAADLVPPGVQDSSFFIFIFYFYLLLLLLLLVSSMLLVKTLHHQLSTLQAAQGVWKLLTHLTSQETNYMLVYSPSRRRVHSTLG